MAQVKQPTALLTVAALTGKELIEVENIGAHRGYAPAAQIAAIPAINYALQVPTTGFNYAVSSGVGLLILDPAGTLATGSVTFPATPFDGQNFSISTTQTVTALTLVGGAATVKNAVTTLAAGATVTYVYAASNTSWYRVQ